MTLKEFFKKVARRTIWAIKGHPIAPNLLEMVWPLAKLGHLPDINLSKEYELRQFQSTDIDKYFQLFAAAGMEKPPLHYWEKHLLPNGFFVIEHKETQALVAACFASHHPTTRHVRAGNFGWLAVDPAHRGQGLGQAITAAVTARLLSAGYQRLYLETHDYRLPAIAIYLKMGWVPLLYLPEMGARWEKVCEELKWPFTPEKWQAAAVSPMEKTLGFIERYVRETE